MLRKHLRVVLFRMNGVPSIIRIWKSDIVKSGFLLMSASRCHPSITELIVTGMSSQVHIHLLSRSKTREPCHTHGLFLLTATIPRLGFSIWNKMSGRSLRAGPQVSWPITGAVSSPHFLPLVCRTTAGD